MIVVMGVSGCGKTTVGQLLAKKLALPFFDADDFHPKENIKKMAGGFPLVDTDRYPWLERLALEIKGWEAKGGAVLACSALKEEYREMLSSVRDMTWVYLHADFDTILKRMKNRNHFMDPALLQSQFDDLEVPAYGIHINAGKKPGEIISEIKNKLDEQN